MSCCENRPPPYPQKPAGYALSFAAHQTHSPQIALRLPHSLSAANSSASLPPQILELPASLPLREILPLGCPSLLKIAAVLATCTPRDSQSSRFPLDRATK